MDDIKNDTNWSKEIIFLRPCYLVRYKVTIDTNLKKCKNLKDFFIQL
tara:strand:+ start:854 stop:994 length:141 start_codon:yes stop_codon:yes gene_type:complete